LNENEFDFEKEFKNVLDSSDEKESFSIYHIMKPMFNEYLTKQNRIKIRKNITNLSEALNNKFCVII
jgi:hypothetical protein